MKKTLIAMAAVAVSGVAMAQSSVTVFGVVDAAVTVYDGTTTVSNLANSGNSSSRLGFRGVEDLGNGLKASFHLEGGLGNDDGTGVGGKDTWNKTTGFEFQRRSTISLLGNFGELRLGRNLTSAYSATSGYDNFGTVGVGGSGVWGFIGGPRRNNMITYQSNSFGGFKFAVDYALGEKGANMPKGEYWGVAATYNNGPLSLGASYFDQNSNGVPTASTTELGLDERDGWSVGGSYNFGAAKLAAAYQSVDAGTTDDDRFLIALSAPVGAAGEVKASYNRYETETLTAKTKADQFALGYVHSLSKRTAVYGTYAYLKNKNGGAFTLGGAGVTKAALDNGKIQAIQVGVRHNF